MNTNKASVPDESDARAFKASDLLKLAGLTYRQLHDWENRAGVLTSERATDEGWRKFTGEEVLALCVCASLRQQFSLPLEKVGGLALWLLGKRPEKEQEVILNFTDGSRQSARRIPVAQNAKKYIATVEKDVPEWLSLSGEALARVMADDANQFRLWLYFQARVQSLHDRPVLYAHALAKMGSAVFLWTDLERHFILSEDQVVESVAERQDSKPFILCPLNSIFNEVHAKAGQPVLPLDRFSPSLWEHLKRMKDRSSVTEDEREVLNLIREKAYQRVTVLLRNGEAIRADAEEDLSKSDAAKRDAQVFRAIKAKDISTITVQTADGQIVRLDRTSKINLKKTSRSGKPKPRSTAAARPSGRSAPQTYKQ